MRFDLKILNGWEGAWNWNVSIWECHNGQVSLAHWGLYGGFSFIFFEIGLNRIDKIIMLKDWSWASPKFSPLMWKYIFVFASIFLEMGEWNEIVIIFIFVLVHFHAWYENVMTCAGLWFSSRLAFGSSKIQTSHGCCCCCCCVPSNRGLGQLMLIKYQCRCWKMRGWTCKEISYQCYF